jgi:hypothetical protein
MSATAAFLHSKLPKGFTWFKQQRRLFNVTLTDLSIHYVLDSTGVGTLTHASHLSGFSEVITIKLLDKTEDDPQLWNEWAEKTKLIFQTKRENMWMKHVDQRKPT